MLIMLITNKQITKTQSTVKKVHFNSMLNNNISEIIKSAKIIKIAEKEERQIEIEIEIEIEIYREIDIEIKVKIKTENNNKK